ncbi:MAG: hypothetical protein PVI21_03045 [Candidatus Woesebacteria bacterium]|jgi:hypothetical protein
MSTETEVSSYKERMQLLISLDELCQDIGKNLIHNEPESPTGDYCKQLIWTIGPATRMLVWGLENAQKMAAMNGLRTLLENWANANYVFRAGKRGKEYYIEGMGATAHQYRDAFHELRDDSSQGIKKLTRIPKWTGCGLTDRIKKLGDGPEFQYEYLSRYVHADVWATLNEFDIKDQAYMRGELLGWGIEFINHTLWLMSEENLIGDDLQSKIGSMNDRVSEIIANEGKE